MATFQIRRYSIRPGTMDEFIEAWRGALVVRRLYGFAPVCAFADREASEFTWVVQHDGDFAAAAARYDDAPERKALAVPPGQFVTAGSVAFVEPMALDRR